MAFVCPQAPDRAALTPSATYILGGLAFSLRIGRVRFRVREAYPCVGR